MENQECIKQVMIKKVQKNSNVETSENDKMKTIGFSRNRKLDKKSRC
ncbi:MAG: hypothetical protein ACREBA_05230 [Nitrosotalea sp.]